MPRSHGTHDRFQSSRLIQTDPLTGSTFSSAIWRAETTASVSPMAKSATASVVTEIPSKRLGVPMVSRAWPVSWSMPIRPSARPIASAVRPRSVESPKAAETVMKASSMSAKYSAGPKDSANLTTVGAMKARPSVASSPATKEPIAAVASAGPPRPARAILLPSSAVTIDALSPGVLSRIDVVDPPYMPP